MTIARLLYAVPFMLLLAAPTAAQPRGAATQPAGAAAKPAGAAAPSKGASAAPSKGASVRRDAKTKFFNFDDLVVDGDLRRPTMLLTTARDQSRFERLLRLRKSFLPQMLKTARYPELRTAGK